MTVGIRDLYIGRLGLPTVYDPIAEQLGAQLAVVGDSTAVGQRRVKGFSMNWPIHGHALDTDPYGTGQRMRRQLRSILQNHIYRLNGLYCQFFFDTERNGWMVIGTANLADKEGGVTLAEYQLTIDEIYRIAAPNTHREGYRVNLLDYRLTTSPIDYLGQVVNTGAAFAALTALAITPLPILVTDVSVLEAPPVTTLTGGLTFSGEGGRSGRDGLSLFVPNRAQGDVISWERLERYQNKSDVVIYDRRGFFGPFGAAGTSGYDISPNFVVNPGFTYDTLGAAPYGWATIIASGSFATFLVQSGWTQFGKQSLRATTTGQGAATTATVTTVVNTPTIAVTAGLPYSMSIWANILSGTPAGWSVQAQITWYTSALAVISSSTTNTLTATGVGQMSVAGATAPAGAAWATVQVLLNSGGAAGAIDLYLDAAQLNQATALPTYFDGDSNGCAWGGTPGKTISFNDPQAAYGWEEVYGADYPYSWITGTQDCPVLDNGLCRVRWDPTNTPGFKIDAWFNVINVFGAPLGWVEQGKITFQRLGDYTVYLDGWLNASVQEWTPERAVILVMMRSTNPVTGLDSRERIYITMKRGVQGVSFEVYPAPKSSGLAADSQILFTPVTGDVNASLFKSDSQTLNTTNAMKVISTAGTGSALWPGAGTLLGNSSFATSENFIAMLRYSAFATITPFQTNITVLQSAAQAGYAQTNQAYGSLANTAYVSGTGGLGYLRANVSFVPTVADQVVEAESATLGTGTASTADANASNGFAATATRTTDANPHITRANWPGNVGALFHLMARVRVTAGTGSFYAKIGSSGATVTSASTTYVWVDLGDWQTGGTLEVHAWTSSGTVYVDRLEAIMLQDHNRGQQSTFSGARDAGQIALYESLTDPRRTARA